MTSICLQCRIDGRVKYVHDTATMKRLRNRLLCAEHYARHVARDKRERVK